MPKTNINFIQKLGQKIKKTWSKLGPGLVTGASDDDPSGITTYTQAGSQFGFSTLWVAFFTFPLMSSIQEMCGRIGLVTGQGIAGVVKQNYHKSIIYLVALLSIPAMILNIGSNLAGMGAVANLIFPSVPVFVFTILSAVSIVLVIVYVPYRRLKEILKWLTLVLLVYLITPFLVEQDLGLILRSSLIPEIRFTKEFIGILVAILGTTISPYLFFWEASMEVEDKKYLQESYVSKNRPLPELKQQVKTMRIDNLVGMFFSNFVMYFIILTAASVLYRLNIQGVDTVEQAASALRPVAGDASYFLFAVGVIGTGFLSIPVLAGACGYVIAETFGWREGMNLKLGQAKKFYLVIVISVFIGLCLNLANINPIQALIWTAMIYGAVSPILIGLILNICNNPKIMGEFTNRRWSNILGWTCFTAMTLSVVALGYTFLV
jgi:NRAMP (natural resistance-associated macrophage protein)-like metal ion transporter